MRPNNALQPTPPPPCPQRFLLPVQAVSRLSFAVRPQTECSQKAKAWNQTNNRGRIFRRTNALPSLN
jgi:hypothetical protein